MDNCVIHFCYCPDTGTLYFAVNRGKPRVFLSGFPPGVGLRPWARTSDSCELTIRPGIVEHFSDVFGAAT